MESAAKSSSACSATVLTGTKFAVIQSEIAVTADPRSGCPLVEGANEGAREEIMGRGWSARGRVELLFAKQIGVLVS